MKLYKLLQLLRFFSYRTKRQMGLKTKWETTGNNYMYVSDLRYMIRHKINVYYRYIYKVVGGYVVPQAKEMFVLWNLEDILEDR
jgi:hypothetical protein